MDFIIAPKKQKEAAAGVESGQRPPWFMVSRVRVSGLARELHLFANRLGEDGKPVLDAQTIDLTVPQVAAKTNKFAPSGVQALPVD